MAQEIIYTSAPKGLKLGSKGFCTVASTRNMSKPLAERLESLSGYRHLFPPGDARNPITYSHVVLTIASKRYHVLSRIADAGFDYSQRSNKIVHHIALSQQETVPAGPAWLLSQREFMETIWNGEPRFFEVGRDVPNSPFRPQVCETWQRIAGDAGWGGVLAETVWSKSQNEVYLIYQEGMDVLRLMLESQALLAEHSRWLATFTTNFTKLPPHVECRWRCVLASSDEAAKVQRMRHVTIVDMSQPLGSPPPGPAVDAARRGHAIGSRNEESRATIGEARLDLTAAAHVQETDAPVARETPPPREMELGLALPDVPPPRNVKNMVQLPRLGARQTRFRVLKWTLSVVVVVAASLILGIGILHRYAGIFGDTHDVAVAEKAANPAGPDTEGEGNGSDVSGTHNSAVVAPKKRNGGESSELKRDKDVDDTHEAMASEPSDGDVSNDLHAETNANEPASSAEEGEAKRGSENGMSEPEGSNEPSGIESHVNSPEDTRAASNTIEAPSDPSRPDTGKQLETVSSMSRTMEGLPDFVELRYPNFNGDVAITPLGQLEWTEELDVELLHPKYGVNWDSEAGKWIINRVDGKRINRGEIAIENGDLVLKIPKKSNEYCNLSRGLLRITADNGVRKYVRFGKLVEFELVLSKGISDEKGSTDWIDLATFWKDSTEDNDCLRITKVRYSLIRNGVPQNELEMDYGHDGRAEAIFPVIKGEYYRLGIAFERRTPVSALAVSEQKARSSRIDVSFTVNGKAIDSSNRTEMLSSPFGRDADDTPRPRKRNETTLRKFQIKKQEELNEKEERLATLQSELKTLKKKKDIDEKEQAIANIKKDASAIAKEIERVEIQIFHYILKNGGRAVIDIDMRYVFDGCPIPVVTEDLTSD